MTRKKRPEYRVRYIYDSETSNIDNGREHYAYPILHQLGTIQDGASIANITPDNVEQLVSIDLYRHTFELCAALDAIVDSEPGYVPVMLCHNLSFDMYGLASWLNAHEVRVLAKSKRKPITFTIMGEDGKTPKLVIWDTLVFAQKPLDKMGFECGYFKASGSWDYSLVRTPETPLTPNELEYAKRDIYALAAWMAFFLQQNPDIPENMLGLNVVTKTGIVRTRMKLRYEKLKANGAKYDVGRMWLFQNRRESPKDDDELFTMHACTRGGFTFCASTAASIPYDLEGTDKIVVGYDATSQHPAMMVSHKYPVRFTRAYPTTLSLAFSTIGRVDFHYLLANWGKPFSVAFNGLFKFVNLRPKAGSIFEKYGVYPLASARFSTKKPEPHDETDNEQADLFHGAMHEAGYHDFAENPKYAFGKLVSADVCSVYLTELAAWEVWQAYEWDSVEGITGYVTHKFERPTDMAVVSVMQFYKAKNEFKLAKGAYEHDATIYNGDVLKALGIPETLVQAMENGNASDSDVDFSYLGTKADLNSLFGVNATNEYRRDTVLTSTGISYEGADGIANKPKNPKAWYQFGQRIVGWSRIAQICNMYLMEPYTLQIINGDTDSIKILARELDLDKIDSELDRYAHALDRAKKDVCYRVKRQYPEKYDALKYIGHYVREFTVKQYCASWNKAYIYREFDKRDGLQHCHFTLAGIPTSDRYRYNADFTKERTFKGVNSYADDYLETHSFADLCNLFLGYNVTYGPSVIGLNMRSFPQWGDTVLARITDYMGNDALVSEPAALNLHEMSKTVNDTRSADNARNMDYALENNADINIKPIYLYSPDGETLDVIDMGEIANG